MSKKYKKGMADAAKSYTEFGKKQEDALNFILEEVRQGRKSLEEAVQALNGNLDGLYEHLKSKEKAHLYTVYAPFDIKKLGEQERLFLVGALYRLTIDKTPNDNQQNYLRAVQKYLDIKEPPFGVDPMAIENIEDIPTQKAIFQTVLEFLRLQDGDCYDETDLQNDFLDCFSINAKNRQAIFEHVELLYNATGAKGLTEKYGYVPEDDADEGDGTSATEATREKGMSAELAKKIYQWLDNSRSTCGLNYIETIDCVATNYKEDHFDRGTLRTMNKHTGVEHIFSDVDPYLLFDGYESSVITGNTVIHPKHDGSGNITLFCAESGEYHTVHVFEQNPEVLAADGESFVLKCHNGGILTVDGNGKQIIINDRCDYAFFYCGAIYGLRREGNKCILFHILPGTNQTRRVLCVETGGGDFWVQSCAVYGEKLYLLVRTGDLEYGRNKYSIFAVDLEQPTTLRPVKENIVIWDKGISGARLCYSCSCGWVFVSEKDNSQHIYFPEYNITFFSFETEETTVIAKGCGYDSEYKAHVFSKTETLHYVNKLHVIGDYVFYQKGEYVIGGGTTFAMVSVHEPMSVKLL